MGVTISCTKTGRTIDVGSGGFLRLRSKISELVGELWASHYRALVEERICDEKEREKFYEDFDKKTEALLNKKRISVKIVDFCLQSDCEGSIRYGACKELLKVIGNYDDNICYPRRGEKFRLGMKFTSTAQAQKAMNALEDGTKTLKDFVNTFDTTPNLTRKQICECL